MLHEKAVLRMKPNFMLEMKLMDGYLGKNQLQENPK